MEESRPLRVFLVENHLDSLHALRGYLEQMGHTVLFATTMSETLAAFPGADCHVLISDIGLPDGSGWELMERLAPSRSVFTIAMSGYGMPEDIERSRRAGFRHHLVKPTDPDQLDTLLAQAAAEIRRD
jgi:CheY-like chemotaxis protein